MLGGNRLLIVIFASLASAISLGCSSDDSASPASSPFDSGIPIVPEAGPQPPDLITVQVQGHGSVDSSDAQLVDGGVVGKVVCSAGSSTSQCTARQGTTLYAIAAEGWVVSAWTTTGLSPGVDIEAATYSYTVTAATPSPLIVVFVPQPEAGIPMHVRDAGAD